MQLIIHIQEYIISMGSQNSKFLSQQQLPHQYRPLKQLPGVYESILNGTRLQKHKIQVNSQAQINYEKDIFIFRRMHADRIISAYFFQKFMPHHLCNMSYQVCFFTEYPEYVMSLSLVIPFERGFQILIECLKGFQMLFNKFGPFPISFQNISFDSHNQPKVWISPDLGKTRIQTKERIKSSEQKMIMEIFRIFDQIKDERNATQTFSNYLKRLQQKDNKTLAFKSIMTYLVDQGSKFFISRSKSISLFKQSPFYNPLSQKQKAVKQLRNNSSFLGLAVDQIKNSSEKQKQKQTHTGAISLKGKNKNENRNSHHNQNNSRNSHHTNQNASNMTKKTSMAVNTQTQFNCSGKLSQFTRQTHTNSNYNGFGPANYPENIPSLDRQRKNRRHNSQQDYKPKEIDLVKQNYCNFNTNTTNATISTSIYNDNMNNHSNYRPNSHIWGEKQLIKNMSSFNFENNINHRNSHHDPTPKSYHFTIKPAQYKKSYNMPMQTHTPNRVYRKSLDQLQKLFVIENENEREPFNITKRNQMENNTRQQKPIPQYLYKQKYLDKITHTEAEQPYCFNNLKENKSLDFDCPSIYNMRPTVNPNSSTNVGPFFGQQKSIEYQKQRQRNKQKQKRVNFSEKMCQISKQNNNRLTKTRHKHTDKVRQSKEEIKLPVQIPINIPRTQQNESHMILSNLQTLKSIINSEYSDIDSQIRFDLQNFIL